MKILAHTSFIGDTGYNNHARSFFCALNKYHTVKIRNLTVGKTWKGMSNTPHDDEPYITQEMKDMLILQTLNNSDGTRSDYPMYNWNGEFKPDVHIVLNDMNNYYFYEEYDGYKIGFCVYESTRYPDYFFKQLLKFDEMWVPTQWQFDSLVEQGYPIEKIHIVPEGVDISIFKPLPKKEIKSKFRFLYFGRWDYRKSTTEVLRAFGETFKDLTNEVELVCSVENPFPTDETRSTKDRIEKYGIHYDNMKFIDFVSREDYIKYLQEGDVFVSCARSEGWNLPLIEAMSCGTPAIYSNWGGQLQFAKNKGIPVKISHIRPANIGDKEVDGEYCEPDFDDLAVQMKNVYENYNEYKKKAMADAQLIHQEFNWDDVAKMACKILEKKDKSFVFITAGDITYMPIIQKLVESLNRFSKHEIIVYGIECDIPFDSPNMIKRKIDPPKYSEYDKWYWKQYACIASIEENYENYVWIDGDSIVNHNIDIIEKYFPQIENYPISDIHVQEEFFGTYKENDENKVQNFSQRLSELWGIHRSLPFMHTCLYVYNKSCAWWFEEIIKQYRSIDLKEYKKYYLWNDEGIDNALRWKFGYKKHLPVSNFDMSGYDGDEGFTTRTLHQFYKFWNEPGPQNFNKIYGYQIIPEDKSNIIWFHGNKNPVIADKMIEYIFYMKVGGIYISQCFFTDIYEFKNFESIINIEGSTMDIATRYGWHHAVFHEIYNLQDYYLNRKRRIHKGDIVVDVGANIGVFSRWAYMHDVAKVIAFEPDKRYFKLLQLNTDPKDTILFNAAVSDSIGTVTLHEADHFGGSNIFWVPDSKKGYTVRSYTLDYLFESKLVDKIDFLKIDTEGAEINIFKGISNENLMKVKNIAMEYHHSHLNYNEQLRSDLISRLTNLGFNSHLLFLGDNNALQMLYFWR
jgi:FkbM family methyltransferase